MAGGDGRIRAIFKKEVWLLDVRGLRVVDGKIIVVESLGIARWDGKWEIGGDGLVKWEVEGDLLIMKEEGDWSMRLLRCGSDFRWLGNGKGRVKGSEVFKVGEGIWNAEVDWVSTEGSGRENWTVFYVDGKMDAVGGKWKLECDGDCLIATPPVGCIVGWRMSCLRSGEKKKKDSVIWSKRWHGNERVEIWIATCGEVNTGVRVEAYIRDDKNGDNVVEWEKIERGVGLNLRWEKKGRRMHLIASGLEGSEVVKHVKVVSDGEVK